ncbi:MAG TPA: DUF4434 domain-containing protein [Candidatus Ozemobacteraceae bacterium]
MSIRTFTLACLILLAFVVAAALPVAAGPFDTPTVESVTSGDESDQAVAVPTDLEPAIATATRRPRITGAFIQLWGSDLENTEEFWRAELGAMRAAGMRLVIPQYSTSGDTDLTPAIETILKVADELKMQVFVGTMLDEQGWYANKLNPFFLAKERVKVAKYTGELVKRFKDCKAFRGLYIPYEDNTLSLPGSMGAFYGAIADAGRAEQPGLKVMISPFTTPRPGLAKSLPTWMLGRYFKSMLAKAKVDIIAWQDGVGGTTKQIDRIAHDLAPIASAARSLGIEVWGNCEVFHRTSPLSSDFEAEPTTMDVLARQIEGAAPFVDRFICFDFNHYFSPRLGPKAEKLYTDYCVWAGIPLKTP